MQNPLAYTVSLRTSPPSISVIKDAIVNVFDWYFASTSGTTLLSIDFCVRLLFAHIKYANAHSEVRIVPIATGSHSFCESVKRRATMAILGKVEVNIY